MKTRPRCADASDDTTCCVISGALFQELLYLVQRGLDRLHGIGVGDADEILTAVAEGAARDDRHVFGFQERISESLAVHARRTHAGEGVESASGLEATESHSIESADEILAALIVLGSHFRDLGEAVLEGGVERGERGILSRRGSAHDAVL